MIGTQQTFYSTAQETRAEDGTLLRSLSGQSVDVLDRVSTDPEVETIYRVRFGFTTFDAYEGELNGYYHDTRQFFGGAR